MQNLRLLVPFALFAALGLVACENGTNTESDQQAANDSAAQPETETESATQTQTAATTESGQAATESVALTVEESPEHGEYLADQEGRALYMLDADSEGESKCMDECAQQWPPLVAVSEPSAQAAAVEESKLDTIQREDGMQQVTYNGHPLYHYVEDRGPGDASGQEKQDEWGEWYLVTAEGEQLEPQETQRIQDQSQR